MEYEKNSRIEKSSLKADICRQTGSKYLKTGKLPSDSKVTHDCRTRHDPFAADWSSVEERLSEAPELEAKILFEWLCEEHPGKYKMGQEAG